ncbi:hypothetical protein [uncultured Cellulomonas sp.]|uniref:hypothetical protein n=1 Tax=uncultured Cellulomonas sp. TaxID=189682 RepID=UPI002603ED73|nr:hypothetical protein [uncultured Cellulomonas sp.]
MTGFLSVTSSDTTEPATAFALVFLFIVFAVGVVNFFQPAANNADTVPKAWSYSYLCTTWCVSLAIISVGVIVLTEDTQIGAPGALITVTAFGLFQFVATAHLLDRWTYKPKARTEISNQYLLVSGNWTLVMLLLMLNVVWPEFNELAFDALVTASILSVPVAAVAIWRTSALNNVGATPASTHHPSGVAAAPRLDTTPSDAGTRRVRRLSLADALITLIVLRSHTRHGRDKL